MANEKRLTEKHYDGKGYYLKCSEECHLVDLSCEDCVEMQKLVDRLGEYEDKAEQTVDAVEVVHGHWEDVQETEMYVPDMKFTITKTAETCSECKVRIGFVGAKRYLFDAICPNCGAKMDGG